MKLTGTRVVFSSRTTTRGRPALVVFSTPTYCMSRFCGPVTDMVSGLAKDYSDRADFILVEIWRDFKKQEIIAPRRSGSFETGTSRSLGCFSSAPMAASPPGGITSLHAARSNLCCSNSRQVPPSVTMDQSHYNA